MRSYLILFRKDGPGVFGIVAAIIRRIFFQNAFGDAFVVSTTEQCPGQNQFPQRIVAGAVIVNVGRGPSDDVVDL